MPYFIGDIVELPLTMTQDYSVFHILRRHDIGLWRDQIARVLSHNGLISFIIHPDYICGLHEKPVYFELLAFLRQMQQESRVWTALPREIARWWRDRNAMRLVGNGASWKIEGPGSARARVAWAELDGERVRYRVE